jgi:hypothetical protein
MLHTSRYRVRLPLEIQPFMAHFTDTIYAPFVSAFVFSIRAN